MVLVLIFFSCTTLFYFETFIFVWAHDEMAKYLVHFSVLLPPYRERISNHQNFPSCRPEAYHPICPGSVTVNVCLHVISRSRLRTPPIQILSEAVHRVQHT